MKPYLLLFLISLIIVSCKPSKKDIICRKWQAVSVKSSSLDQQIAEERNFIDTVGTSTDADANEILYGVRNIDSMRQIMSAVLDSTIAAQEMSVKQTWLDFHKDGTVITHFGQEPDTVAWYFDDDGALMLDELKQKGAGSKIRMEVVKLDDQVLQLQFLENGFSSTATFHPAQ